MSRRFFFVALGGAVVAARAGAGELGAALPDYLASVHVSGRLRCSGAGTMRDLVAAWTLGFNAVQPDAVIENDAHSTLSAQGVTALLDGRADIVTFVREPFPSEIAALRNRYGVGPTLINVAGGSYATKGGTHALAIYVNTANPLSCLTLAQLDAIYSQDRRRGAPDAITRWGQLGLAGDWAQRPIHVYGMLHERATGNPPGIVNFLQQRVLLGGQYRGDIREQVDRPGETALAAIVHRVAADPAGVGYSGFAYAAPGAKAIALAETAGATCYAGTPAQVARRDYPLSREIYLGFVAAPGRPLSPLLREFVSFVLSRQGQQIVADDHMRFIPLSAAQAAAARRVLARIPVSP
jgi:phosphate transport system substrate-binding protein